MRGVASSGQRAGGLPFTFCYAEKPTTGKGWPVSFVKCAEATPSDTYERHSDMSEYLQAQLSEARYQNATLHQQITELKNELAALKAEPVGFKKAEPPSKFDMDWSFYAEDDFRIPETLEEFKAACYHFHKAGQQSQPEPVGFDEAEAQFKAGLALFTGRSKKYSEGMVDGFYYGYQAGQQSGEG
jgi:hypothetical protein